MAHEQQKAFEEFMKKLEEKEEELIRASNPMAPNHTHAFIPSPGNGHASPAPYRGITPLEFGQYDQFASRIQRKDGRVPATVAPYMPNKDELRRVLGARLRIREGEKFPMEFIDFHMMPEKVYVFIVTSTGATIIEDDPVLFPSDSLITAINLLKG